MSARASRSTTRSAATSAAVPRHRHLSRGAALRLAPSLAEDSLTGAIRYHDAQVDDARHTLAVVRTAAGLGAACASAVRVVGMLTDGERVVGARVHDTASGADLEVRARVVIGAVGAWTDRLRDDGRRARPDQGPHEQGRAPHRAAGTASSRRLR